MTTQRFGKRLALIGTLCLLLSGGVPEVSASGMMGTGSVVFDPTNLVQNMSTALNTASVIANQASQLYYMYRNMKSMPSSAWSSTCGIMSQMSMIAGQLPQFGATAQMLSTQFAAQNPGYTPTTNYNAQYGQLTNNFNSQLNTDLSQVSLASSALSAGSCQLQYLNGMNTQGFMGRMQALQTATQVGVLETSTLQQMQSLQMQQAQEQRLYMAHQVQTKAAVNAAGNCFAESGTYGVGHANGTVTPPPAGCGANGTPCQQTTNAFGDTVYVPATPPPACAGQGTGTAVP